MLEGRNEGRLMGGLFLMWSVYLREMVSNLFNPRFLGASVRLERACLVEHSSSCDELYWI